MVHRTTFGRSFRAIGFAPEGARYAAVKLEVLDVVTQAIGSQGMIGGQVSDLEAESEGLRSPELLFSIHDAKTGRLIRASATAGGLYAFASDDALARLDAYGRALGLAFQIKDDLLDVESDAATLGKASHKDAAAGKATFPAVWGVERSRALLVENVEEAIAAASQLPGGGGVLPELARFVGARKS